MAPLTEGCIRFHDITVRRTGLSALTGEVGAELDVIFDDVDWDGANNNASWLNRAHDRFYGVTAISQATASGFLPSGTNEHRCFRGVTADLNFNSIEGWLITGCQLDRAVISRAARTFSGAIIAFNKFLRANGPSGGLSVGTDENVTGFALVQNLIETTTTNAQPWLRMSADSATGNVTHAIVHNNTLVGFNNLGRGNLLYDDHATLHRAHSLNSFKGNIHVQINTKGQLFKQDGTFVGNESYDYGVGCEGEFSQFVDAGPNLQSFRQRYPGLRASIGTSSTVRNDPLFTNYQGTINNSTPGNGGGDYKPQPGAPTGNRLASAVLSHDLAGTARPTTWDGTGAYATPVEGATGTGGSALDGATGSGAGSVGVSGSGGGTLDGAAGAGSGDSMPVTTGEGGGTLDGASGSGAGGARVRGSGASSLADATATGSGAAVTVFQPTAETGPIIATSERTVTIAKVSSAPYAWASTFDPADRAPYAIDWSQMLDQGEKIDEILMLTMSASGASVGVEFDSTEGREPIIGTDGKTIQFWFLCNPAFQRNVIFTGAGVQVSLSALIRTDADPYKEFERTAVLTVKQL
jgi:hypothetical protein